MPTYVKPIKTSERFPDWLNELLTNVTLNPVSTSVTAGAAALPAATRSLKTGAGALSEYVGKVLSPTTGKGMPKRLAFSALDPARNRATVTALDAAGGAGQHYESTARQLASLLRSGHLAPEPGPHEGATVPALVRRLQLILQGRTE